MRLGDDVLPDRLLYLLPRRGAGEILVEAVYDDVMLVPEMRHVGEHEQRVHRRGRCLRCDHVFVPDPKPRLFGKRRGEEVAHALEDPLGCATKSRVIFVASLGQGRRRRFAEYHPSTVRQLEVAVPFGELEEKIRIVVLGEEPKESGAPPAVSGPRDPTRTRGACAPR